MKNLALTIIIFVASSFARADTWKLNDVRWLLDGGSISITLLTDTNSPVDLFFDRRLDSHTRDELYLGATPETGAKLLTGKERSYYIKTLSALLEKNTPKETLERWRNGKFDSKKDKELTNLHGIFTILQSLNKNTPNQALQTTTRTVTPAASHPSRQRVSCLI